MTNKFHAIVMAEMCVSKTYIAITVGISQDWVTSSLKQRLDIEVLSPLGASAFDSRSELLCDRSYLQSGQACDQASWFSSPKENKAYPIRRKGYVLCFQLKRTVIHFIHNILAFGRNY